MDEQQNQEQPNASPEPEDYAGYQSLNQLRDGYRASGAEAKKWRDLASRLEQQLTANAPRPTDPYQRLSEYGIPQDDLHAAISQTVQGLFAPLARGFEARNRILTKHPDYNKFESDVAQHLATDQDLNQSYQRMFAADPEGAMEYAYLKFGESRKGAKPEKTASNGASADAQIPNSRSGDARRSGGEVDRQNLRDLWEHGQKTGNVQPYIKARLRQVIPDSFFNQ